ncbi:MAG: D-alanyl-D-alanine carboxypeptidase/D-alanyl-D-alanine-endopeptidase [Alphaproteobacteria bacterium]|jgi:D-alanyl-D-alanine carboxypeptidase/D-alanyl-D-alanine-endopeptidase (penicillin-binding protein 4)|nr:D-alanyl-D-alanine carboxypeptidase/D-alanyl-D-alanine-endopeptidase [Alphaproteobacteria bacterium]
MKYRYFPFVLVTLCLIACSSEEQALYEQKPAFYSYIFGNVYQEKVDKETHADVLSTPASCQKTVTALAALKALGPDFQYETKLYASKKEGVLQDVVIGFVGDPTLTSDDLTKLLSSIKGQTVQGYILLDASRFTTQVYSPNVMIDDMGSYYMPPVSSMNIDSNLFEVKMPPGPVGQLIKASSDSPFAIDAKVTTAEEGDPLKIVWVGDRMKATGHVNPNEEMKPIMVSPKTIDTFALYKMQRVMDQLQIKGNIVIVKDRTKLPKDVGEVASHRSIPLKDILPPALKMSDNFVFDSLYLTMLHRFSKEAVIDDWAQGDAVMKALMKDHYGVDMEKALMVDGSGLSRYNRIQPLMLFQVLKKGYEDKNFVNALARPGEEGSTLKNRTDLPEKLYAKTGGLMGVSCLCGYELENPEDPKAFVVMVNGFAPTAKELFQVIDPFIHKSLR